MLKRNRLFHRIKALFAQIPPSAPESGAQAPAETPIPEESVKGPTPRIKMGFAYHQDAVTALGEAAPPLPGKTFTALLTVSGTTIGSIQSAGSDAVRTDREIEIVNGVAAQLSRHLEDMGRPERNGAKKP